MRGRQILQLLRPKLLPREKNEFEQCCILVLFAGEDSFLGSYAYT